MNTFVGPDQGFELVPPAEVQASTNSSLLSARFDPNAGTVRLVADDVLAPTLDGLFGSIGVVVLIPGKHRLQLM
ncbi:MAG: hypothetical protein ACLPXZ_18400 [Mycobacterium sp.]